MSNIIIKNFSKKNKEFVGLNFQPKNYKINIISISKKEILKKFFSSGLILFDKFNIDVKKFYNLTRRFTDLYSNDAFRRSEMFNNPRLRSVDLGYEKIQLHSESSFTLTRPDIMWFMCINPPKKNEGGRTTFCDGKILWDNLKKSTKQFFLKHPIIFHNKIKIKKFTNQKVKKWFLDFPGIYDEKINFKENFIFFKYKKYAVERHPILKKNIFANHILSANDENQIEKLSYDNNKKIPPKIIDEIRQKTKNLTLEHSWKKNQIIMLDNLRFMHGRTKIFKKSNREIINVQTLKANLF